MLLSSMMQPSFSAPDQSWLTLLMSLPQDDHPDPSGLKVDAAFKARFYGLCFQSGCKD